jgi:hypothetical protein
MKTSSSSSSTPISGSMADKLRKIVPLDGQRRVADVIAECKEWKNQFNASPASSSGYKSDAGGQECLVLLKNYLDSLRLPSSPTGTVGNVDRESMGDNEPNAAGNGDMIPRTALLVFCLAAEILKLIKASKLDGTWEDLISALVSTISNGVIGADLKEKDVTTATKASKVSSAHLSCGKVCILVISDTVFGDMEEQ